MVAACCLLAGAAAGRLQEVESADLVAAGLATWLLVPEVELVLVVGAGWAAAGLLLMVAAAMVVGVCRHPLETRALVRVRVMLLPRQEAASQLEAHLRQLVVHTVCLHQKNSSDHRLGVWLECTGKLRQVSSADRSRPRRGWQDRMLARHGLSSS